MSTDTKLSKAQMFKKLKSSKSFGSWLCNLGKISLTNIAIPLAKDNLPLLVINLLVRNKYTLKKNKWERSCESKTFVWRYKLHYQNNKIISRFGCNNC